MLKNWIQLRTTGPIITITTLKYNSFVVLQLGKMIPLLAVVMID